MSDVQLKNCCFLLLSNMIARPSKSIENAKAEELVELVDNKTLARLGCEWIHCKTVRRIEYCQRTKLLILIIGLLKKDTKKVFSYEVTN